MTGTDHCNPKLSKNIQFERDILLFCFNVSENLVENLSSKVIFWKDCMFPLTKTFRDQIE